jgi:acyl-CoA synthetase (AMP-forming)/AMP-acid ligase II
MSTSGVTISRQAVARCTVRAATPVQIRVIVPRPTNCPAARSAGSSSAVITSRSATGYAPGETQAVLPGSWMNTGDAGYLDDCGYLFIVDRLEDMVITHEENVYSAEAENVPAKHPAVAACAVVASGIRPARESIRLTNMITGRGRTQSSSRQGAPRRPVRRGGV